MSAYDDFKKIKKASGMGDLAAAMPSAIAHGLAGAGVAAGVTGVGLAVSKIYDAVTKTHDFKRMLEHNADLQEHYQHAPKTFNQMFSTLRSMNPSFSKDPIVAGSYLRRMMESPMHAGGVAVEAGSHAQGPFKDIPHPFGAGSGSAVSYLEDRRKNRL